MRGLPIFFAQIQENAHSRHNQHSLERITNSLNFNSPHPPSLSVPRMEFSGGTTPRFLPRPFNGHLVFRPEGRQLLKRRN